MKKQALGIVLTVFLFCSLFAGCGNRQTEDETVEGPVTHGTGISEGTLDGNTYTLPRIGMELRLPESFEVVTGKALDQQMTNGASVFYRFAARNQDRQEVLTLFVPNTDQQAAAYLESARKELESKRETVGEVQEKVLGGFTFQALRAETVSGEDSLVEWSLAYEQGGKLFCINNICLAEDEEAVLKDLDTVIIQKIDVEPEEEPET